MKKEKEMKKTKVLERVWPTLKTGKEDPNYGELESTEKMLQLSPTTTPLEKSLKFKNTHLKLCIQRIRGC